MNQVIHPVSVEILRNAITHAEETGASAVLVRLNTPGGLMDAMRECVELIVASPVPVITYVTPSGARAASAGFFLLQAGDLAAMAPGTNTGAASPVLMGQEMDATMRKKVEEDASASLRSVVTRRGRNAELAETTVLEAKAFTEEEALKQNLINLVAASDTELFEQLESHEYTDWSGEKRTLRLRGAVITPYTPSLRERLMSAVSNPNIAFVLTVLGALGVYVEFTNPGFIFPGVAGAICILVGLSALSILPINWMGVALLVLALLFFILEATATSHGILGTGGAIAMTLGAVLLIDSPVPEMRIAISVAVAVSMGFAAITVFLLSLVVRAARNKVATGVETMPGRIALAVEDLDPAGRVRLDGDFWNAISSSPVAKGEQVRVLQIRGLTLDVEPAGNQPTTPS
ncbi:MAG: nodulation protein NfeD [Bryobacterales bacterium]|nr:nodulation protein NfeD [Bryobacterales bacterium]